MAGGSANYAIGEHLLVMTIAVHAIKTLRALTAHISATDEAAIEKTFEEYYRECGGTIEKLPVEAGAARGLRFVRLQSLCESEIRTLNTFTARLPMDARAPLEYSGALCTFADFLLPLFDTMRALESFPDGPVFLMLDDADNLPLSLQRVINTWISMRTTTRCCLKVTTQLGYGTYRTLDSRLIESPHDFGEVDITAVYTSSQDDYHKRVRQIVEKRFQYAGIAASPDDFFPVDKKQAARLQEIQDRIRAEWHSRRSEPSEGRKGSYRPRDEVARQAGPELMRELSKGRSSATFSYAGFASMVNLSSGVIRWFLEPAADMYSEVLSTNDGMVERIPVGVQDRVIRRWSIRFFDDLAKHGADSPDSVSPDAPTHARVTATQSAALRNLIEGLGELFGAKLLDPNSSERRAFSIVLRGEVNQELSEVLNLGIRLGYLQLADNAAKEGSSRRHPRYIFARRLGPRFYLDVSGYAAHLSVTADDLKIALTDPRAFLMRRLERKADSGQVSFLTHQEVTDDDQ